MHTPEYVPRFVTLSHAAQPMNCSALMRLVTVARLRRQMVKAAAVLTNTWYNLLHQHD
ncbi:MAG: hypothetical protein ACYC3X_22495 [Pirellulaceae bacterium]